MVWILVLVLTPATVWLFIFSHYPTRWSALAIKEAPSQPNEDDPDFLAHVARQAHHHDLED